MFIWGKIKFVCYTNGNNSEYHSRCFWKLSQARLQILHNVWSFFDLRFDLDLTIGFWTNSKALELKMKSCQLAFIITWRLLNLWTEGWAMWIISKASSVIICSSESKYSWQIEEVLSEIKTKGPAKRKGRYNVKFENNNSLLNR